ncbi:hypothetical protein BJ508DRAFT_161959 [Ascobolus immersus RN42]|uniref:Secreted protein n=1 Tax=Ascobolus immersus RN42 TaxID=1160509 RepID=A0A3N4HVP5_ASCIM|nr:hypothetical protein BJ508DRAFT_161959 [Ascobolus immersus RN42]
MSAWRMICTFSVLFSAIRKPVMSTTKNHHSPKHQTSAIKTSNRASTNVRPEDLPQRRYPRALNQRGPYSASRGAIGI